MIRESRPRDIAGCWSEALSQWIKQNYSTQRFGLPSWRSLLKAVAMVDRRLCKELAAKHSSEMLQVPFAVVQPPASPENRQSRELSSSLQVAPTSKRHDQLQPLSQVDMEMIRSNEEEIRALFSSLLLSVQKALVAQSVNVSDVHQFLVNFFQQSECFHSLSTFGEIFIATTVHRLWDYQHYSPLELLTKQFLPTNQPIATSITEYKANLTGFFLVTKLVDYIKYKGLEAGDGPQQPLAMMKLTPQQYRKIKVVLDLNRKVSELSLEYVQNLWFSFADEYELPCLTAVIDKIVTGSLEVSWLVLSHLIARIKPRSRFFRRHQIILVFIDDVILYDEKTMPGYEKQLLLLCAEGRADLSQFSDILNRGVDPDIHNQSGHHPLLYAVFHKRADLVHLLLENKANVNLTTINDNFAESALIQACHGGHEESAAILIKNSADVNYMDKNGRSPLWKASYHGYSSIVLLLLQHNAQVDLPTNNEHGETALFAASAKGHLRTATILLQYGAVVNYTNKLGNTPLFFASKEGHDELMDLLLAHGAEVNKGSQPPLFGASEFDRVHIVRHLIQRGADVNLTTSGDDFASSPLGKACNANQLQVVKVLIENGAMINYRNKAGWTGLLDVTEHGREEIVQYLLHSNADTEVQNQEGRTALLIACWRGFLSIVVILIKFGANTNAQDREGLSGLMLATEKDESAIVEALLDAKADPNITDKNTGWSALFFASKNGNIKIIQLLIASGAQVNLLDKNGLTAYDIAESNGHHHVSEELKQHTIQEAKTEITEDQQKQVKKSYQRLSRIFDVLEETLLRGRKEKRLYQTVHKGVSSNITQANQQTDNDNF